MRDDPYFIFGLPRSRTTWLAAFLTTEETPCYHEKSIEFATKAGLAAFLRKERCGIADTALGVYWKWVAHAFPRAPIVVVLRDYADVVKSLESIGFKNPTMLRGAREAIDELAVSGAALVVDFERLARRDCVESVCEHVGVSFNAGKWYEFSEMQIEPHPPALLARMFNNVDNIRSLYRGLL